jgi:AAA-like domain
VGGHPFMVRRGLYALAGPPATATADLFASATDDRGPFGDHLRYHLLRLYNQKRLTEGLLEVIRHQRCSNEEVSYRLEAAGLVQRRGSVVQPRCGLYAAYFGERLGG